MCLGGLGVQFRGEGSMLGGDIFGGGAKGGGEASIVGRKEIKQWTAKRG